VTSYVYLGYDVWTKGPRAQSFFDNSPDGFSVEHIWQQIKQTRIKAVADNIPSNLWEGAKRTYPPWLTAQVRR